jgi:hypothetical protein
MSRLPRRNCRNLKEGREETKRGVTRKEEKSYTIKGRTMAGRQEQTKEGQADRKEKEGKKEGTYSKIGSKSENTTPNAAQNQSNFRSAARRVAMAIVFVM